MALHDVFHDDQHVYYDRNILVKVLDYKYPSNGHNLYHFSNEMVTFASSDGHFEVVNVLLAAGAEVDENNKYGNTPLHDTSSDGHFEVVKVLIRAKADVRIRNNKGEYLLM